jgi:hypothetical protein
MQQQDITHASSESYMKRASQSIATSASELPGIFHSLSKNKKFKPISSNKLGCHIIASYFLVTLLSQIRFDWWLVELGMQDTLPRSPISSLRPK